MIAHDRLQRSQIVRWLACTAVIVTAHAGVAASVMSWEVAHDLPDIAGAIVVEFASEAVAAPTVQNALPPGPEQVQAEAAVEQPHEVEIEREKPEIPPSPDPVVAMPEAQPPAPEPPKQDVAQAAAPMTSAPQVVAETKAVVAAAPSQGTPTAVASAALPPWTRKIALILERNKRYPDAARSRREGGTTQVAFVLDRAGHLLSSTIAVSSGYAALDQEAISLLQRTQPFPPIPATVAGAQITLRVPILFSLH